MEAFVHTKNKRADGTYDCYFTVSAECKRNPMRHHMQGLSYTASGYGKRIPTEYMIKYNGRWQRVYCAIYSNAGTLYIGKKYTPCLTVSIDN